LPFIQYEVECEPRVVLACHDMPIRSFGMGASPISEMTRRERVPLFFDGDYDGGQLFQAIIDAINSVYRDTACKPERVLVGRYTFVELWAHLENRKRVGHGMFYGCAADRYSFEEGRLQLFDVEIQAASGADHFIAAQPTLSYLITRGVPEGAVVLRT